MLEKECSGAGIVVLLCSVLVIKLLSEVSVREAAKAQVCS